jgi:hypothetical protein
MGPLCSGFALPTMAVRLSLPFSLSAREFFSLGEREGAFFSARKRTGKKEHPRSFLASVVPHRSIASVRTLAGLPSLDVRSGMDTR